MKGLVPIVAAVTVLLVGSACSRKSAPPAAATPPLPQLQSAAEMPDAMRAGIAAFGEKLEGALRDGDSKAIREAFDVDAIVEAICEDLNLPERAAGQFKGGMREGLNGSVSQIAQVWAGQAPKFKGAVVYGGRPAARFRFSSDTAGISIVDLVVAERGGALGIVNFYNHVADIDLVDQVKQTSAPMLARMDKSFLERLLSKSDVKGADYEKFGGLSQKLMAGDFDGVIASYQQLPPTMRDGRLATTLYITALQRSGDDGAYREAIKAAAARFNTPNYDFMLVDVYFLEKDFAKAIECLDRFMGRVERDAEILSLKALMQTQRGEASEAAATVREALALEPGNASVHTKGLDALLAVKDFAGTRDSMIFLEENAQMNFKPSMGEAVWAEFVKAPESARWRQP